MEMIKNKVCGADIHKKFLVATILSRDGTKTSERFGMMLDNILKDKKKQLPASPLRRTERKSFPLLRSGTSLPFQASVTLAALAN